MDISEYGVSPNADPIVQNLVKYDLLKHAVEFEAYGMTVVPPEKMGVDDGFVERLRNAILRTCEKRHGVTINDHTSDAPDPKQISAKSWFLLEEDEAFVEAATNPRLLALVRWLCGQSVCLTGQTYIIKPPTTDEVEPGASVGLHSDAHGIPPGGGHIAHVANASFLCTDYDGAEDGPTVFVPGSHHYGRATLPHEAAMGLGDDSPFKVFPLIGKAGSLALWHGSTWHGTTPRMNPGLRVTLVQVYMRMHMARSTCGTTCRRNSWRSTPSSSACWGSTPTRSGRTSRTWRPSPRSCTRARIRTPDDRVGSHGASCRRRLT